MAKLVSKVYGDALFEVAVESGRLDEIWEQTRAMQTALEENPELFALMRHPKIVKEEKVKIIESIFTGCFSRFNKHSLKQSMPKRYSSLSLKQS